MIGILFILFACALWSIDTLIRYPLLGTGVSPETIVFLEHLFLTFIFMPLVFRRRKIFFSMTVVHLFYFVIIGGLGSALGTLAFTRAFTLINPSLVILLQKFQPVFAIILARVFLKESISKKFIVWAFVCLIGGLLISAKDILGLNIIGEDSVISINKSSLLGYGLTFIAVFSWGSSTVFGKQLSLAGFKVEEIMASRFIFGLLILLPIAKLEMFSFSTGGLPFLKIGIMVLISGVIAMYFYYKGLGKISARGCSLAEMSFPFFAVIVNWYFLGAELTNYQIFGGALLLLGSTVIQLKKY